MQALRWTHRFRSYTVDARRRYGPTFTARIGSMPASVVTVDRDAVRRMFTGDPLTKRHANDILRPVLGDRSVLLLEPREHLQRRKLLLPPFHGERVRAYADVVTELVEAELDRWEGHGEITVLPRAQDLTLEVIMRIVLGMRDDGARARLRATYDAMINAPGSAIGHYFPHLLRPWKPVMAAYLRKKAVLDQLVTEQIAAARADPELEGRRDILAMLVLARDESGHGLTDAELVAELNTLLVAGHETAAAAIAWGAELLAHHPDVAAEAVAGDADYVDALAKEVLRIRSPLPLGGARRMVEGSRCGPAHPSRRGPVLVDLLWGVHNDPALYPDPAAFRPTRFLDSPPDSYAFLAFGGGAHRCLGASLAQLEIKSALSGMVGRYELRPARAGVAAPVRRAITLVPEGGGRIVVRAYPSRSRTSLPVEFRGSSSTRTTALGTW